MTRIRFVLSIYGDTREFIFEYSIGRFIMRDKVTDAKLIHKPYPMWVDANNFDVMETQVHPLFITLTFCARRASSI